MTLANRDRRVSRTRQALQDSLHQLIREKGYDAVTVEEITTRANLGRTTFYLHYRDKEDLLMEPFKELAAGLVNQLADTPISAWQGPLMPGQKVVIPLQPLALVFQMVADNQDLFRTVLAGEQRFQAGERMVTIIVTSVQELAIRKAGQGEINPIPDMPLPLLAGFFAGSLVGSLMWWVRAGLPFPPEEMARKFIQLFSVAAYPPQA